MKRYIRSLEDLRNQDNYSDIMKFFINYSKLYYTNSRKDKDTPKYIQLTNEEIDTHTHLGPLGIVFGDYLKVKDDYILPYISDKVILDLGAGAGRWSKYFTDAKEVVCVDIIKDYRDILLGINDNITFKENNGYDLTPINDDSVDFVFAWNVFIDSEVSETKCISKYVSEFSRVLKDGGRILFDIHSSDKFLSNLINWGESFDKPKNKITDEEIKDIFNSNNLILDSIDVDTLEYGNIVIGHK